MSTVGVVTEKSACKDASEQKDPPKSQRYLEDEEDDSADLDVQQIIAEKVSSLIASQIEFTEDSEESKPKVKKSKSMIRLLDGVDEYVKLDAEIVDEVAGPTKKPKITKRVVEEDADSKLSEEEKCKGVVVDGEAVLAMVGMESWSSKRKGEEFAFKAGKDGKLHFLEPQNEFTKIRKKNTWSEKRICTSVMWK